LVALVLIASAQVASAAPKDKVDVLDGATLNDRSGEPELLERQLTSFRGACDPACEDVQVAQHVP
jgi:hypothetical protein